MIDCCIFDLDGVVVDTARYHYLAWAALARELGFEFTPVQGEATKCEPHGVAGDRPARRRA